MPMQSSRMRLRPRTISSSCRRWSSEGANSNETILGRSAERVDPRISNRESSDTRGSAADGRVRPAHDVMERNQVTNLTDLTLAEARDGLKAKRFSSTELTRAHVGAIEKARALNAFVLETPERALEMAQASEARLAKGEAGALEGLPLGIKDLFCTKGFQTTAGSNILKGFEPQYESTITQQLWREGAVMLGKLNSDEFAMGSSNETSAFGPVVSPWRREGSNVSAGGSGAIEGTHLVPGGSSGGSAAAVAAHLCLAATATDTGGSIRQPAAFTGTVGIKPTYGRVSRWGTVAFASSLDQAGPIARTVRDAAIMMTSMSGFDAKDSTSADIPVPDFAAAVDRGVNGLTIGIPREYRMDGMPDE